jgi:hypothetical protein
VKAPHRLWRTESGGLVADGDPAARVLAYAQGHEVAPADEAKVPGFRPAEPDPAPEPEPEPQEAKRGRRPADKARARAVDKGR